jgi:AcrR family transcriptional regulator
MRQNSPYCFTVAVVGVAPNEIDTPKAVRAAVRRRDGLRHLGADDRSSQRVRIVDAALRCLARQGLAKTTVDDIAREAGISRATLYRTFPGGKESVVGAVVDTEAARFFSAVAVAMGEAHDLEDVLVAGMVEAARRLSSHEALGFLLAHEPGTVLPHLAFGRMDGLLLSVGDMAAPFFARWLEPDQAARAAEWAIRIVFSYLLCPDDDVDLTDPDSARYVARRFVLPGILALRAGALSDHHHRQQPSPTATIKGE